MTIKKLLGNKIVIELPAAKTETAAGIILTDDLKELPQIGIITQVGTKVKDDLKIGDKVLFHKLRTFVTFDEGEHKYCILDLDPTTNEVFCKIE